jgi:uncharacterized protein
MAEERLVLSDASPLIALAACGSFGLLRELFGAISITAQVRGEVLAGGARPGATELRRGMAARWIRLHRTAKGAPAFPKLGVGEASVLSAALAAGGDCYLLLDDEPARREARALGIQFTGTLGVLVVAKRRRLIPALKPCLERLFENGFHFSPELARNLLRDVGED